VVTKNVIRERILIFAATTEVVFSFLSSQQKGKHIFSLRPLRLCGELSLAIFFIFMYFFIGFFFINTKIFIAYFLIQ